MKKKLIGMGVVGVLALGVYLGRFATGLPGLGSGGVGLGEGAAKTSAVDDGSKARSESVPAVERNASEAAKKKARRAAPSGCYAVGAAVEARWPPSADGFDANWPMAGADKAWYAVRSQDALLSVNSLADFLHPAVSSAPLRCDESATTLTYEADPHHTRSSSRSRGRARWRAVPSTSCTFGSIIGAPAASR